MSIPKLKPSGVERVKKNHPWLPVTDILDKNNIPERPTLVPIGGQLWLCSPKSYLRFRRIGPEGHYPGPKLKLVVTNAANAAEHLRPWFSDHIRTTLIAKLKALKFNATEEDPCLRWIFSENDFLPGLVLDVFGTKLVAQINSAPMEWLWPFLKPDFEKVFKKVLELNPEWIEKRNASVRLKEGLPLIEGSYEPQEQCLRWNGFQWLFRPGGAQKTGGYLDQRDNHTYTAQFAREKDYKTAWDLCSFEGGFSLHLLAAGLSVTAVDQSPNALATLEKNIELNALPKEQFNSVNLDVFEYLKSKPAEPLVDLIVLDPPSFVKGADALAPALKGYKELNIESLKRLKSGGMLVSCVCSRAITKELYKNLLFESAKVAGKTIEILAQTGPSPDHSPNPNFPEGDYLHAWYLLVK